MFHLRIIFTRSDIASLYCSSPQFNAIHAGLKPFPVLNGDTVNDKSFTVKKTFAVFADF